MSASVDPTNPDLQGWKEIADHLKVAVRTAQMWEQDMDLPVLRVRNRVFASSAALTSWRTEVLQRSAASPEPLAPAPAPPPAAPGRPFRWIPLFGLLAATLAIGAWTWHRTHPPNPVSLRIAPTGITALDADGNALWSHVFPGEELGVEGYNTEHFQRYAIADLDGDGANEVVFALLHDWRKPTSSTILCFGPRGEQRWTWRPGHTVRMGAEDYPPPYWTSAVLAVPTPQGPRVLISSNHYFTAPNQIAALDANGRLTGEYWNPGHLLHLLAADLDHDGAPEVLAGGLHNGLQSAVLLVFDPLRLGGAFNAGPRDETYHLHGLPPSTHRALVQFPRSPVALAAGHEQPYNRVYAMQLLPDAIEAAVVENTAENDATRLNYRLRLDLQPLDVFPSTGYQHRLREYLGRPFHGDTDLPALLSAVRVSR